MPMVNSSHGHFVTQSTRHTGNNSHTDGKRHDGMTGSLGRRKTWDVTAVCPLATSYLDAVASNAGSVAETAAERKTAKYADLGIQPIAVESLGPMLESVRQFLVDLDRKITDRLGDDRDGSFLFQHISVLLHHFNSVLFCCTTVLFQLTARIDGHSVLFIN